MGQDFQNAKYLPWMVTGFFFSVTVATPLYGKLADTHGRRAMILLGIALFVLGSIVCAMAASIATAIVGRLIEGLGAAGLMSTSQVVVADLVPTKKRARYLTYTASIWLGGNFLGPILGGWLIEHYDWRLIFWLNVPFGLIAFWTSWVTLKHLPRFERPHKLDLVGAALLAMATLTLLLYFSFADGRFGWFSRPTVALAVASIVLWMGFALRIQRAPEPFIRPELLRSPVILPAMISAGCTIGAFSALLVFVPIFFRMVGMGTQETGAALIPLAAGTSIGALISARVAEKAHNYTYLPMLSLGLSAMLCLLLAAADLPPNAVSLALGFISLSIGAVLIICTIAIQNSLEPHQFGSATSAMNFVRALCSAVVVGLTGAVLPVTVDGVSIYDTISTGGSLSEDQAAIFTRLFLASASFLLIALLAMWKMEVRPLRNHVVAPTRTSDH